MFNKKTKKKLLIVEDDALLSQILSKSFLEKDVEVSVVDNGFKVLESAKKFGPDAILLDLVLPGLDGFAVLKQLKSAKETRKISVVVLSNLDAVADIKSTQVLGAEKHFTKADIELKKIVDFILNSLLKN
ncbi:MAG: response regulator [Candidatus Gracilibacteria bacterium]|jgi:two-component system OmpR family response regulator